MTYTDAQIKDSVNRVIKFYNNKKRLPNYVRMGNNKLTIKQYTQLTQLQNGLKKAKAFCTKNKRMPNYVTVCEVKIGKELFSKLFNYTCTSTSTKTTSSTTTTTKTSYSNKAFKQSQYKQDTNYYCGVNCMQLAIYKLTGKWIKESIIAGWCGTTTAGTSTSGMSACLKKFNKKYGTNLKLTLKNFSDLSWKQQGEYLANKNTFLFYHLLYRNKYGHYETLKNIKTNSDTLTVYNSLSGGYIEKRSKATQKQYCKGISQPSIIIISK